MNLIDCIAVVRCKKEYTESYPRNRDWLPKGLTAFWPVSDDRTFGGVVVLIDSADTDRVEVWAGRTEGADSGRYERAADGRWTLKVKGEFLCLGLMQAPGTKSFLGKQPANTTTYIDRDRALDPPVPQWLMPAAQRPGRGFDPEKAGDRVSVTPGAYTTYGRHADVVNSLYRWLNNDRGFTELDNALGWHDLHGFNKEGHPELFEVKTAAGNADVYEALGQLQVYELVTGPSRKIIVLPRDNNTEQSWHQRLFQLGVALITFEETDAGYSFAEAIPAEGWHR